MNSTTRDRLMVRVAVGLLLFVAVAASAVAQSNVTINGTVKDQSGGPVPGAVVTATDVQTGINTTAPTNEQGYYSIVGIPPGSYDVQVEQRGFATMVRRNQQLLVGTTVTLDFTMHVSSVVQTVQVEAVSPELEPTQSSVTSVLKPAQLDDLPILSRNFSELAALTPGVQATSQISVGFSVGGAVTGVTIGNSTQYETGYTVDDVPIVKPADGGLYVAMAQDWVQEFSVISNQAAAQYPGAVSGVVNAITRSGGNQIHGRVYSFFQNSALNASNFNPVTPITTNTPTSSQRVGGMIGGPIIKNKLFYFGGYEYYRSLAGAVFSGIPASFAGTRAVSPVDLTPAGFSNLNRQVLAMVKITYQVNPQNSLNLIGNYQFINEPNQVSGGYVSPLNGNSTRNGDYQESIDWRHVFSESAINELRADVARDWDDEQCRYASEIGSYDTSTPALTPYGVTTNGNPTGYYAELVYPGAVSGGSVTVGCNGRWGGSHFIGLYNGIYENFIKIKGKHTIEIGGNAQDPFYGSEFLHSNSDGTYTFPSTATATNAGTGLLGTTTGPFDPTNPLTFPQRMTMTWGPFNHSYVMMTGWSFGMFAQDTWRATDSFTVNLGIRWDGDLSYSYYNANQLPAGQAPVQNDFRTVSPRIGIAWSPFPNKNTVFRGGFGVYYGPTTFTEATAISSTDTNPVIIDSFISNSSASNPYCISPGGCGNANTFAGYQNDLRELMAWSLANDTYPDLSKTSVTVGGNTYSLPGFTGTIPRSGLRAIDPDLKKPAALQVTFGVAHNFNNGLSFTSNFAFMHGFDLDVDRNINLNALQPITPSGGVNYLSTAFTTFYSYGSFGWFDNKQLLLEARYNDHRGDFGEVSYTLGWCNGNTAPSSDFNIHSGGYSTDPLNFSVDDGPCTTDQREILAVDGSVLLPGRINFAPILTFGSGLPMTPTTSLLAGQSATVGGVVVTTPGCQIYYQSCYPARNGVLYTNGSLRGDDTIMFSARVQRTFRLGERMSITPMFEAYNIPNVENLGTNYTVLATSPSFGKPSSSTITMRQLQLGVRFDF